MPLHACIHASDEIIVTVSTVGVEARIAGKRVTQVCGSILDHLSPLAALGFADRAIGIGEIASAYGGGAKLLDPAAHVVSTAEPGNAADRVVAVLRRLREVHHA